MLHDASTCVWFKTSQMAKITGYMRVTKQSKAHDATVDASSIVKKQHVDVEDEKKTATTTTTTVIGPSKEESRAYIPTFIYEVTKCSAKC